MPHITTYHCLCTQVLLATPYSLSTLPQRQPPSLDHARILPLGQPPTSTKSLPDDNFADLTLQSLVVDTERNTIPLTTEAPTVGGQDNGAAGNGGESEAVQYSLLLNTTLDRRPVIVRREDGFEKRWVRRCGRCRTGMGYVLWEGGDVVYLLEEGLVETGSLRKGAVGDREA